MAHVRLLLLILILLPGATEAVRTGCFEFPTLYQELLVEAEENAAISLPFRLLVDSPECSELIGSTSFINVYSPSETQFCILRAATDGTCSTTVFNEENCKCNLGDNFGGSSFTFTKTVTRDDMGTWTWKADRASLSPVEVVLDIASTGGESEDAPDPAVSRNIPTEQRKPTNPKHRESAANTPAGKSSSQTQRKSGPETPKLSHQQTPRKIQNGAKATPAMNQPIPTIREESQFVTATTDGMVSDTRDDLEGGTPPGGWAVFGGVFVAVNIVTIIAVATTIYVLKGRRERRRRRPTSSLPPTPKNKTAKGGNRSQGTGGRGKGTPTSSYIELESRPESRKYEEIPAVFPAVSNDGYEVPMVKTRQQLTQSGYEAIF